MKKSTKLNETFEGSDDFKAWKYRVMLILEEHDLDGFIKEEVKEHKNTMIKVKRIIANSIKDQLIP